MAKEYKELMEEMLDLAGIPLDEAEEDEEEEPTEGEPEEGEPEEGEDEEEPEEDKELADTWEVKISVGSTMKIKWYDTYLYVWYKEKKSPRIKIPQKLIKYREEISNLLNKIMSYVERVS
jgi:hypothetical protein